jgi:hypothetical protein
MNDSARGVNPLQTWQQELFDEETKATNTSKYLASIGYDDISAQIRGTTF